MTPFQVGQQVVCINGVWHYPASWHDEVFPIKDQILTIRDILPSSNLSFYDGVILRFEEIHNKPRQFLWGVTEVGFRGEQFRPLVKTDISIFEKMLAPTPELVE